MSLRNNCVNIILFIVAIFFTSFPLNAQDLERELNSIPVYDSEGLLPNIFSGGNNNIEHQFIDIDDDGDLDIFILDSDGTYGWYKNEGTPENPEFVLSFEDITGLKLSNWFFFVDMDSDNDFDLFTGGADNFVEYRENTGTVTIPSFTLVEDTVKVNTGEPIFSEFSSNPVFADVDDDNDIDLISGNTSGTLYYYENIGNSTNFNFKFVTNQWQDIEIIGSLMNPDNLHGASSLDFVDIDNDNDLDLFWGDFFSKSLYFIRNNGTAASPDMEVVLDVYPQNEDSVYTRGFNMPRFADIDNDGDQDLFVSVLYDPTILNSLIFLRNEGTPSESDFNNESNNYLKTLDVGTQSTPAFVDIDNDLDLDMFLGSNQNPEGRLHFFENTGTPTSPSYQLIDSVYNGISGELSIAPAFGDIDNDGDSDLFIGNFNGEISFYENTGTAESANFQFQENLKRQGDTLIDVGVYARPLLIDFDNDGDLDLITGGFNGKITLYENTGTPSQYSFTKDENYFNGIDIGDNSFPFLFDIDNDSDYDLFTGTRAGNIILYKNEGSNVLPEWVLNTNNYKDFNFGGDSAPYFVDIDNDTDFDLFVGNIKGGLYFFRNNSVTSVDNENNNIPGNYLTVDTYPNPFNPLVNIEVTIRKQDKVKIIIYNFLGEKIYEVFNGFLNPGQHNFKWNGTNKFNNKVASGNYIVVTSVNNKNEIKKITFIK